MRLLLVALAVLAVVTGCLPASMEDRVDKIVHSHETDNGPALAIAVVKDGQVAFKKVYGYADIERQTRATSSSVFDLASLGKQVTGAAVLLLVERGKLSLEDDVRQHVPELREWNKQQPITIRHLSQHISGLPEFQHNKDQPRVTTDDVIAWVAQQKEPAFPAGERWRYTNTNYVVLARVVESASGKRFADFVRDEIFKPASMTSAQVLETPETVIRDRVTGYCRGRTPCRFDTAEMGAANIFASIDDMIAWDRAWETGVLPERRLVDGLGGAWPYAFGWGVKHRVMWHDGDWLGAATYIVRYLDRDLTVIVLSAQAKLPVEDIEKRVAALYLTEPK